MASNKEFRFPEGVMTKKEWLERYVVRVEAEKFSADADYDRRKFNSLEGDAQDEYVKQMEEKASKVKYVAYSRETNQLVTKMEYDWLVRSLKMKAELR